MPRKDETQKHFYMKFHKADWKNDPNLTMCSPATRGIWIDILATLDDMRQATFTASDAAWARFGRCTPPEAAAALRELAQYGAAEVEETADGIFTVTSRRLAREYGISEKRSAAAQTRFATTDGNEGCKEGANRDAKEDAKRVQKPSYNSDSNSVPEGELQEREPNADEIERIYQAYPRRVAKAAALVAIRKAVKHLATGDDVPAMSRPEALTYLLDAVTRYAHSPAGNAGNYTPYPASWFNRASYLDEEKEWQHGTGTQQQSNRSQGRSDGNRVAAREAASTITGHNPDVRPR